MQSNKNLTVNAEVYNAVDVGLSYRLTLLFVLIQEARLETKGNEVV